MKITTARRLVKGEWQWVVDWTSASGQRQRKFFADERLARAHARELRDQQAEYGQVWLLLPPAERQELIAVRQEIVQAGLSLSEVWQHYLDTAGSARLKCGLGQAIAELLQSKTNAGCRASYVSNLGMYLRFFARGRESMALDQIRVGDIEEWIAGHDYRPAMRASAINRLSTLFSWAKRRGYVVENPCERCERIRVDRSPPVILTHDQVLRALQFAQEEEPDFLAWLALALFGGLRPEEADKVAWSKIDLDRGTARIESDVTKVRSWRIVNLMPATVEWLKVARSARLPVPQVTRRRFQRRLREHLGFATWPKDILRHTAASHWLAEWQDAGRVATELGNSPAVLLRHYRKLVTKDEAKAFWTIHPLVQK
ncbi:MAG: tyrosine-type recombinase/integrase [Candidatus Omnitrophica bacterium]|nr:tyrosine-type recombinase/integrase [Candidatus Omnitrophota bacterium]